jgi:hypothetical protein
MACDVLLGVVEGSCDHAISLAVPGLCPMSMASGLTSAGLWTRCEPGSREAAGLVPAFLRVAARRAHSATPTITGNADTRNHTAPTASRLTSASTASANAATDAIRSSSRAQRLFPAP